MDAVKEAESIGISKKFATNYDYTAQGVCDTYTTLSATANAIRRDAFSDNFDLTAAYASNVLNNKVTSNGAITLQND